MQFEGPATRSHYLSISSIRWINSTSSQSASLLSVLLLSIYLRESLPRRSLTLCIFFSVHPYRHYHILIDLNTLPPADNKLWEVEFMKPFIMKISPVLCYFLLKADTFLSTLYSNNLNVISSLNMSDRVLQMYKSGKLSGIEQYLWDNNVTWI